MGLPVQSGLVGSVGPVYRVLMACAFRVRVVGGTIGVSSRVADCTSGEVVLGADSLQVVWEFIAKGVVQWELAQVKHTGWMCGLRQSPVWLPVGAPAVDKAWQGYGRSLLEAYMAGAWVYAERLFEWGVKGVASPMCQLCGWLEHQWHWCECPVVLECVGEAPEWLGSEWVW